MPGGGLPYEALKAELRQFDVIVPEAPNVGASRIDALRELWRSAGLKALDSREINVQRVFASFDDYWRIIFGSPSFGPKLAKMSPADLARLEARMRERLAAGADGGITCSARANAVKGRT